MFKQVALRLAVLAALMMGSPAMAHENHDELGAGPGPAVEQNVAAAADTKAEAVDIHMNMAAAHGEAMGHHAKEAEASKTFGQRLVSWLGRLHSLVVHFPIAMFLGDRHPQAGEQTRAALCRRFSEIATAYQELIARSA